MNDTLSYFEKDPIHRQWHQDTLTFAMLYEYSERFIMPLSHDEVVHGKRSLLQKMPGDFWQKVANLRLLLAYIGCDRARSSSLWAANSPRTTNGGYEVSLDWHLLADPTRAGLLSASSKSWATSTANRRASGAGITTPLASAGSTAMTGAARSWRSNGGTATHTSSRLFNFTPVPRAEYRIGVPTAGAYLRRLSSDDPAFGGSRVLDARAVRYRTRALARTGAVHRRAPSPARCSHSRACRRVGDPVRPALRALADRVGIMPSYLEQNGRDVRETTDASREALLAALGHDASTESAAAQRLTGLALADRARLVASVQVWREYEQAQPTLHVSLPPELARGRLHWEVELALEDGGVTRNEGEIARGGEADPLELPLPGKTPTRLPRRTPPSAWVRWTNDARSRRSFLHRAPVSRWPSA